MVFEQNQHIERFNAQATIAQFQTSMTLSNIGICVVSGKT